MSTVETHNRGNRIYGQQRNTYKIKGSIDCKITGTNYRIYCTKCKKNICIYILDKQKTAFTDE